MNNLTPAQDTIARDLHRFRVLCCGRRFGKTTLAVEEIKARAYAKPSKICYLATTYAQARDIAWATLKSELEPVILNANESRLELIIQTKDGGQSSIFLHGWEAVETLRGQAFDFLVLDEVASMRMFFEHWQEVLRPTLTDRQGEALFCSTPKGFNHFYDLFNMEHDSEKGKEFKSFHFTSYDNPHLPVEELVKAKNELPPDRFAQEYMADFKKTEGLVYKEFDRSVHLFQKIDYIPTIKMVGVDFGFTNPAAVITLEKDRADTFYVTAEYYEKGKTDVEIADYVASLKANVVFPDPEAPEAIKELKKRRINVRDVVKGKDSIQNGIAVVRELLRANKLKIHSSCKHTIRELETYSYPDTVSERNQKEVPIDDNNHALDAIRYILMMSQRNLGQGAHHFIPHSPKTSFTELARGTYAHSHLPAQHKSVSVKRREKANIENL